MQCGSDESRQFATRAPPHFPMNKDTYSQGSPWVDSLASPPLAQNAPPSKGKSISSHRSATTSRYRSSVTIRISRRCSS